MSSLSKMNKNIALYNSNQVITKTIAEYEAEKRAIHDIYAKEYTRKLELIIQEYNKQIDEKVHLSVDILLVSIAYELGKQLQCFDDEVEYKDEKIELVQNILTNVHKEVENYFKKKRPVKEFNKIKKKVKDVLKIEF